VFGGERAPAPPAERRADVTPAGRADVYAAVTGAQPAAGRNQVRRAVATPRNGATLPKTATDAELGLWFGLALCCASPLLIVIRRRRRHAAQCLPR
jgi:LPXTG-motif cell wall-anchored protein